MVNIKKIYIALLLCLLLGLTGATVSQIIGVAVEAPPITFGQPACTTFSYDLQETITQAANFAVRAIAPVKTGSTLDNTGSIIVGQTVGPNDVIIQAVTLIPFALTGSQSTLSTGDNPIPSGGPIRAKVGIGGSTVGKTFVVYPPPAAACPVGGFTCIGVDRVNGVTLEARAALVGRQTNFYGFDQDADNLYVLTSGDGTPGGTTFMALHKIAKSTLTATAVLVLDTNNNSGGQQVDPFYDSATNAVFAPVVFDNTVHKVSAVSFTDVASSVNLGNNINGLTVMFSLSAGTDQVYATEVTSNTINGLNTSNLVLNTAFVYPGARTTVPNGMHPDVVCASIHLRGGDGGGTVAITRWTPGDGVFNNTFSGGTYSTVTQSASNVTIQRIFLNDGTPAVSAVRMSTP